MATENGGRDYGIDWLTIRRDWETTNETYREVGARHGVSHTSIARRAKAEGWSKTILEDVKAGVGQQVLVKSAPKSAPRGAFTPQERTAVVEEVVRNVAAQVNRHVDICERSLRVGEKLMAEIEQLCDQPDLVESLAQALAEKDDARSAQMLRQAIEKATSLPSRASAFQRAQGGMSAAIATIRTALGLDNLKEPPKDREPLYLNFAGAPAPAGAGESGGERAAGPHAVH